MFRNTRRASGFRFELPRCVGEDELFAFLQIIFPRGFTARAWAGRSRVRPAHTMLRCRNRGCVEHRAFGFSENYLQSIKLR